MANGQTTFTFTSGKNYFDFPHIDEVARQVVAATLQGKSDGVINIYSRKPKPLAKPVEWYIRDGVRKIPGQALRRSGHLGR